MRPGLLVLGVGGLVGLFVRSTHSSLPPPCPTTPASLYHSIPTSATIVFSHWQHFLSSVLHANYLQLVQTYHCLIKQRHCVSREDSLHPLFVEGF